MKKLRIKFINIEEFTRTNPSKTNKKPGLKKVLNGISEKNYEQAIRCFKNINDFKTAKRIEGEMVANEAAA